MIVVGKSPRRPFAADAGSAQARGLRLWLPMDRPGVFFDESPGRWCKAWNARSMAGHVRRSTRLGTPCLEWAATGSVQLSDDAVTTVDPIGGLAGYTVTFWAEVAANAAEKYVIYHGWAGTTTRFRVVFDASERLYIASRSTSGEAQSVSGTTGVQSGLHHYACIFNIAGDRMQIYIDGALSVDSAAVYTVSTVAADAATETWLCSVQNSTRFLGKLADLRLYDHVLSLAEIKALWNPATRWDLYDSEPFPIGVVYADAGGVSVPKFYFHRTMQGMS